MADLRRHTAEQAGRTPARYCSRCLDNWQLYREWNPTAREYGELLMAGKLHPHCEEVLKELYHG